MHVGLLWRQRAQLKKWGLLQGGAESELNWTEIILTENRSTVRDYGQLSKLPKTENFRIFKITVLKKRWWKAEEKKLHFHHRETEQNMRFKTYLGKLQMYFTFKHISHELSEVQRSYCLVSAIYCIVLTLGGRTWSDQPCCCTRKPVHRNRSRLSFVSPSIFWLCN